MSYIGKLENDSILGADENGSIRSLSLGGGLTQTQGSLTAQVDWNTAFDIDMTTAVTCSYTSDGVASMAGLNWDLWNSHQPSLSRYPTWGGNGDRLGHGPK